jgi:hypothetical protein
MQRDDNILSDAEHLYAEDLNGREATLTVRSIGKEEPHGGGKQGGKKFTFRFVETPKAFIPGIGVRRSIVSAIGSPDKNKIIGARLVLYPTTCEAFGKSGVPCIRFKGLAPAKGAGVAGAPGTDAHPVDADVESLM